MKVANVATTITSINSNIALIAIDFSRVRTNLLAIGTQLFLARAFSSILLQLAHVATSVNYITLDITTVSTKFAIISPYFVAIRVKFAPFSRINVSSLSHCNPGTNEHN